MSRAIDFLITYRVIKLLVTPFNKTKAYERGIIDADGKNLIKFNDVPRNDKVTIHTYTDLFLTWKEYLQK